MGKRTDNYVASRVSTVVGKGTEFIGTLKTKETVRIEGHVDGEVESDGTFIVGFGGRVDGKINAENILIGGEVHGDLFATGKIEINPTGKVYGNIHTKELIVDEKALFTGTCEMTGREETKEEAKDSETAETA